MPKPIITRVRKLRSKRDLRAEIVGLAAAALERKAPGELHVIAPLINPDTIRAEWKRVLPALSDEVRGRLSLIVDEPQPDASEHYPLPRPNYRYEALRLLIGAKLEDDGPQQEKWLVDKIATSHAGVSKASTRRRTPQQLIDEIGASQTPVRSALAELEQAGVVFNWGHGRGVEVSPEELSIEMLGRLSALPQIVRFRFERGARIKPPLALLDRARPLLKAGAPVGWEGFALSGVPVALQEVPRLDLVGLPRLDLVARIDRDANDFDLDLLRALDDGLELETNVLASAPVVVTLVRSGTDFFRSVAGLDVRCATPADVLMSLLDMGLREQALQYAKGLPQ